MARPPRATLRLLAASAFLALLLLVACGASFVLGQPRVARITAGPIDAVYLTTGRSPVLPPTAIRATGLRAVSTFDALQAEAATARAIIIDRELLPLVPPTWLAQQYRQEKMIVGIDIPIVDLAHLAEYEGGVGGYLSAYGGRDFYAYFYTLHCPDGRRYGGSGSEAIYSADTFPGLLQMFVGYTECELLPTSPPITPQSRPTQLRPTEPPTPASPVPVPQRGE